MSDTGNGADRVNAVMAATGKKETENASLRARLAEYDMHTRRVTFQAACREFEARPPAPTLPT